MQKHTFLIRIKSFCEKCFQPISNNYRAGVLKEIECVLNHDFEEFKKELEKLLIPEILIDTYQAYHNLPAYNSVRDNLDKYNKAVIDHNNAVKAKTG